MPASEDAEYDDDRALMDLPLLSWETIIDRARLNKEPEAVSEGRHPGHHITAPIRPRG